MQRDQRFRIHLTDRPGARVHNVRDVHPGFLAAQRTVGFVPQLHHAHFHTGRPELLQAVQCIFVRRLLFGVDIHACPGPGNHLFPGIRPEVRIMEIRQKLHPAGGCPFPDLHRGTDITVAAAEAVAVCVIRIVPDPDADIVDPVVRQQPEQVRFISIEIVIFHTAGFFRQHAGDVHAEDKILRQVLHLLHVQRVRTGFRSCAYRKAQERRHHQQDYHTSVHSASSFSVPMAVSSSAACRAVPSSRCGEFAPR